MKDLVNVSRAIVIKDVLQEGMVDDSTNHPAAEIKV